MVPEAGLEPARYYYQRILSPLRLPISPLGQKIQDLFAIRLWSSRVLSEVASHHSCKFDSIQPLPHYLCALETPGFSCIRSNRSFYIPQVTGGS